MCPWHKSRRGDWRYVRDRTGRRGWCASARSPPSVNRGLRAARQGRKRARAAACGLSRRFDVKEEGIARGPFRDVSEPSIISP